MNHKENLDNYANSYKSDFKYNNENSWFLTRYAQYMSESIRYNNLKNILSLGIGQRIVGDLLSEELNFTLEKYIVLEGSKSIIDNFVIKPKYKNKISVIHTYFEDYQTDEKFDAIEMGFILEHVDDPVYILNKYKELLSKNGRMFIAVPNARSLHRLIGYEAGLLADLYKLSSYDLEQGHKRYFDLESISDVVKESGLKINNKIGLLLKPITTNQIEQLGWNKNIINALVKIGNSYPDIANCILLEASL
ncbi:MAG: class I SAM-dependent methyltransferase [Bacteroidales bacterium]|nr:class I SAM-dependent methyltransferase [Saprospiraceae bacterium]MCF8381573.1 class I SAM-dependent methyltransferase [Bacteroidales bacterium]